MAEGGLGQQHAGQERPHRHRQPTQLHQQRSTQHHQQRGGSHHLARLRFGQDAEQRIEQIAADHHQANNRTDTDGDTRPARANLRTGIHRRHPGNERQQRHDQQILEQQDGDDLLP
ncbi:hypothetical protein D3C81_633090 [compost metagenome]